MQKELGSGIRFEVGERGNLHRELMEWKISCAMLCQMEVFGRRFLLHCSFKLDFGTTVLPLFKIYLKNTELAEEFIRVSYRVCRCVRKSEVEMF